MGNKRQRKKASDANARGYPNKKAIEKEKRQKILKSKDSWRIKQEEKQKAREKRRCGDLGEQLKGYAEVNGGAILYGGIKFPYVIRENSSVLVYYQGEGRAFSLGDTDFRKRLINFIGGMG